MTIDSSKKAQHLIAAKDLYRLAPSNFYKIAGDYAMPRRLHECPVKPGICYSMRSDIPDLVLTRQNRLMKFDDLGLIIKR